MAVALDLVEKRRRRRARQCRKHRRITYRRNLEDPPHQRRSPGSPRCHHSARLADHACRCRRTNRLHAGKFGAVCRHGQSVHGKGHGHRRPKVALINNGAEEHKGTPLQSEAYQLLKADKDINFIGNIEGREIPEGNADVLVADGFTGNIVLKMCEGLAFRKIHPQKAVLPQRTFQSRRTVR